MNVSDAQHASRKGRGCLLICGLLLLVAVTAVTLNFNRLSNLWETGRKEVSDLFSLRSGVQSEFNVRDVSVSRQNSSGTKNLIVELQDPTFANMEQDDLEAKLKEIAAFAHEQYAASREIDNIKVVIAWGSMVIKEKREYSFSPAEFQE